MSARAGGGKEFHAPGAEDRSPSTAAGACPTCAGTGIVRDGRTRAALVPDESQSPSTTVRRAAMGHAHVGPYEAGVRRDGRAHRRAVSASSRPRSATSCSTARCRQKAHPVQAEERATNFAELDFTYLQRRHTRWRTRSSKAKDEKGLARVARFLKEGPVPRLRRHAPERPQPARPACATG